MMELEKWIASVMREVESREEKALWESADDLDLDWRWGARLEGEGEDE